MKGESKMKIEVRDLVSIVALIGGVVLLALGQDWGWALVGAVLTHYGIDFLPFIPVGRIKRRN